MRQQVYTSELDRQIIIGMILNPVVLARIASIWDGECFSQTWFNVIAQRCINYYRRESKPPGNDIHAMILRWANKTKREPKVVEEVDKVLASLSEQAEHTDINPQFIIDLASERFTEVRMKRTIDKAQEFIDNGNRTEAITTLKSFTEAAIKAQPGTPLFTDNEAIDRTFALAQNETLVDYDDAASDFFGNSLARDSFVCFVAPEKVGKTFWLMDIAYRGVNSKKRTAFFGAGDMSLEQMAMRLLVRVAKHPQYPCTVKYPVDWKEDRIPDTETKRFDKPLTPERAKKACKTFMQRFTQPYFHLEAHPTKTLTVERIRSTLLEKIAQGWIPDVVCVDYADILAPPIQTRKFDSRDQINSVWEQLRSLSLEFHVLLCTATQATRLGQKAEVLRLEHLSDDKRKAAHVTAMFGINQRDKEKENQVYRLNVMARRSSEYSSRRVVHTAACLELANPCVLSTM